MKIVNGLKKGFTLTELITTVLILALMAAIAIPTYRDYVIRAKMVDVLTTVEHLLDEAKQQYVSNGTIPAAVGGISSGVPGTYSGSECIDLIMYNDGASWTNAGQAAVVQAIITEECGRGIKGFVPGISGGAHNTVSMAFLVVGETMQQYCGDWSIDGTEIPVKYLPSGCQNTNFGVIVAG